MKNYYTIIGHAAQVQICFSPLTCCAKPLKIHGLTIDSISDIIMENWSTYESFTTQLRHRVRTANN